MGVLREKLYEEVWAEPMTTVARRYDVSSNFLARVCEQLNVPRPSRGYWAQLKAGQKVPRPPLAAPRAGDQLEWSRDGSAPKVFVPAPGTPPRKRTKTESATRHPLLVAVRESFEAGRLSREGYLKPYKHKIVDIFVSKETLKRALDVANALFLKLEDRGHHVLFRAPDAKYDRARVHLWDEGKSRGAYYGDRWRGPSVDTVVLVNNVSIGLTLFEISAEFSQRWDPILKEHVKDGAPRHPKPGEAFNWQLHSNAWFPSGRLALRAYAARPHIKWDRYWREAKAGELPGLLDTIAKNIETSVPAIEKLIAKHDVEVEEARRRHEEQRKRWEKEEAERRRVEREAQREKEIVGTISNWRMARDIRAFVAEIHGLVNDADLKITEGAGADQELKWAMAYADRIDPLTSWRRDIEKVKAEAAERPCPDCGKVHGAVDDGSGDSEPGTEEAVGTGDEALGSTDA